MTNQMITARGLTKTFRAKGQPVEAVRDVDLHVNEGELVAFLGPNGAGKSTTLRMLTTLLPPTAGDAIVAGCDIRHDPAGVRRRIGYVGQGDSGGHAQRVRDELHAQGAFYGMGRRQTRARAAELIESRERGPVANPPGQSRAGGPKRGVGIARGREIRARPVVALALDRVESPSQIGDSHARRDLLAPAQGFVRTERRDRERYEEALAHLSELLRDLQVPQHLEVLDRQRVTMVVVHDDVCLRAHGLALTAGLHDRRTL